MENKILRKRAADQHPHFGLCGNTLLSRGSSTDSIDCHGDRLGRMQKDTQASRRNQRRTSGLEFTFVFHLVPQERVTAVNKAWELNRNLLLDGNC